MMNKALRSAWRDFQYMISQIDNEDNQITIFKCIQSWYFDKKKMLSSQLIEEYQLEELINIDIKNYPLEKSECTPQDIKRFLGIDHHHEASMIACLRDLLWELIVLSVEKECRRCGKLELSALFNVDTEKVFLECTQCGWVEIMENYPVELRINTRLATNDDLKVAGLI